LATAVTLLGPERVEFVERTYLTMRADLSDDELERYVATGEGRQCAGGYQVEALGVLLFSQIEGCWTNVLGLPMPALVTALRSQGWRGL
jgi:septum formation protein